jgi:hypothetical protein
MSELLKRILNDESIVTGMLIVIAVSTLTFAYRHLRPLAGRQPSAHSKTRAADGGRRTGGDPWMSPPPRAAAGHPAPAAPSPPGRGPVWDAGSVEVASWILSEAKALAAEIRHEARDEVSASLADAKKEAAELLRQASDQAAAKVAAAEAEAAEARAALIRLSSGLSEVAANLQGAPVAAG